MKLSFRTKQEIYGAVHQEIALLRILLKREYGLPAHLDRLIAEAGERAAESAVSAAKGTRR